MKKYMNIGLRTVFSGLLLSAAMFISEAMADNYMAVSKGGKVFDEPNATGYVTLNQKNEEVTVLPGMVFKVLENQKGWNIIEYSPGLRGYMSDELKHNNLVAPKPGTYPISNNRTVKLTAEQNAGKWNANVGGKNYRGEAVGNIVVFFDDKSHPAYSLVDMGNGPIVMSYDNAVTKFF